MPITGDNVESLLVEVRASTQGFEQDIQAMRGAIDTSLVGGFERAGQVLERGLISAIRRGSLGFDDLKRVAFNALSEIAAQAVQSLFSLQGGGASGMGGGLGGLLNLGSLFGSGSGLSGGAVGGIGGLMNFSGLLGSIFGLPGRATGGPVAPGRGYLVGERGPELFVPTSSGRVEAGIGGGTREVRVSINITAPPGGNVPQALQRSGRQVASAVRRALSEF